MAGGFVEGKTVWIIGKRVALIIVLIILVIDLFAMLKSVNV